MSILVFNKLLIVNYLIYFYNFKSSHLMVYSIHLEDKRSHFLHFALFLILSSLSTLLFSFHHTSYLSQKTYHYVFHSRPYTYRPYIPRTHFIGPCFKSYIKLLASFRVCPYQYFLQVAYRDLYQIGSKLSITRFQK